MIPSLTPECSLLHLDVKHDPLVLFHMDTPDAVLPLVVGLRPIRRQHHTSRVCDLPAAHSCNAQTPQVETNVCFVTDFQTQSVDYNTNITLGNETSNDAKWWCAGKVVYT